MIRLSSGWLAAVAKSRHALQEVEAPLRDVWTESRVRAACSLVLAGWCAQEKGPLAAHRGSGPGVGGEVSAGTQGLQRERSPLGLLGCCSSRGPAFQPVLLGWRNLRFRPEVRQRLSAG